MRAAILTLTLLPTLALAQVKPLPWPCSPWDNWGVPYKVIHTVDGRALLWACQVNTVMRPYELHCTKDKCKDDFVAAAELAWRKNPAEAFWARATTSGCLGDLAKAYWPSAQEKNLCREVRIQWNEWGLK